MKKSLYILGLGIVAAGIGFIFFREANGISARTVSDDRQRLTSEMSSDAAIAPANGDSTETGSVVPIAGAAHLIPVIDGTNPNYASAMAILERSFLAVLQRDPLTQDLPPERTVAVANRLAVLRLSQTMFEATIASISKSGNDVRITIPAYPREGEALQKIILMQMFPEIESGEFKAMLGTRFGFFGKHPQQIDVKGDMTVENGEKVYTIAHRIQFTDRQGSAQGISTLSAERLGYYMPFQGWFPKS